MPDQSWPAGPLWASGEPSPRPLPKLPWHRRLHWRLVGTYALITGPLMLLLSLLLERALAPLLRPEVADQIWARLGLAIGAAYAASLLLVSLITRAAFSRPLAALASNATHIAAQNPGARILVERVDELGLLAESINYLAEASRARLTQTQRDKVLLAAILDGMTEGVIVCDQEGHVLLVNPAARRLLELGHRDPTGKLLLEVYRAPLLQEAVAEVVAAGQPLSRELSLHRRQTLHVSVAAAPLLRQGDCIGAVLVLPRHHHPPAPGARPPGLRRQRLPRAPHPPGQHHRLHRDAPLRRRPPRPPWPREFVETIDRHGKRLAALVTDLLMLARLEARGERPALKEVSLHEVVEEVIEGCEVLAEQRQIYLHVAIDPAAAAALAEPRALTQVLRNLVENGVHYTREGGEVSLRSRAELDTQEVCVEVRDNGVGIEPQHLSRIFERFYRVDKGRSRDAGGTGLGLAIAKHMVLSMGGDIEVSSVPGQGTVFTVRLPAPRQQGEV
jgi:two-component system phosphate regulon sensor histidine kinase PhoR